MGEKFVSALGAGCARDLAREHQRAQRLLGRVVCRRYRRIAQKRPHRWPQFEQIGTGVGRAGALRLAATLHQSTSGNGLAF